MSPTYIKIYPCQEIYWVGQKVHLVFPIFFIFTNHFIDLDILSMSAISRMIFMSRFDHYQFLTSPPDSGASSSKSPAWNFANHFLSRSVTAPSPYTAKTLFQLLFYLSWNNKAYFLPSSILKWLHKNWPILVVVFF